ncbi:MAG: recombinase RecA [Candidatus Coatesbacteria bacterium]|nr:MAG: recombinase RecA [Candidatus Coatesbacteria bacterium]
MATANDERDTALRSAVDGIRKKYGETVLMRVGDEQSRAEVEVVPTGCLSLDAALGVGGVPRGRLVEIFGPEASGKTTLALHVIAEAQKMGGHAALVDLEYAFPLEYARTLGVDVDELWVSQPDSGEQALDIVEQLVRSNAVDVVVVDSVAALVPRAELEGEMGDAHVGLQARLMSQALRKLTGIVSKTKTIVVFINQIRMKIGVMFGNPETTPGGNALKFFSSLRLDIRRIATIKEGENAVGNRVRVKVVKNKVAPPFRQAEFDIVYGEGISALGDLLDLAAARKIVDKAGTWYSFGDERLGQGRANAVKFLKENEVMARQVEAAVRAELGLPGEGEAPPEEAEAEAVEEAA